MHFDWLIGGCPRCGGKKWSVTSDNWAYCMKCNSGYDTDYPFTHNIAEELDFTTEPAPVDFIEMAPLRRECALYLEELNGEGVDDDREHFIFEKAMEAIYGPNIWAYINERQS